MAKYPLFGVWNFKNVAHHTFTLCTLTHHLFRFMSGSICGIRLSIHRIHSGSVIALTSNSIDVTLTLGKSGITWVSISPKWIQERLGPYLKNPAECGESGTFKK